MGVLKSLSCCGGSTLASLSRAAAKAASSRLRQMGLLREETDWTTKAKVCETCPMQVIERGVSYCGRPFLSLPVRNEAEEGCGCPTIPKAKTPGEHCPIDWSNRASRREADGCTCKWCNSEFSRMAC